MATQQTQGLARGLLSPAVGLLFVALGAAAWVYARGERWIIDAQRLDALRDELQQRNLAFSFDEGWDASEGAEYGAEQAEDEGAAGYVYCHVQDIDRLIHTGDLFFGFGTMKTDDALTTAEAVGEKLVEALRAVGFAPDWDGNPNARVLCQGLVVEYPLAEDLTDAE